MVFKRFKRTLDEALDRLEDKFGGELDEDTDRLLSAMRDELIEAKARIPEIETQIEGLERQKQAEWQRLEACVRRGAKAQEIGDTETVSVALEFEEKHKNRLQIINQKIETAQADLEFQKAEVLEMTGHLKDAMKRKHAISAQARRASAIETTRGDRSALDEFDRMADKIEGKGDVSSAEQELDDFLEGREPPPDPRFDRLQREADADAMLEELKRRMGVDDE